MFLTLYLYCAVILTTYARMIFSASGKLIGQDLFAGSVSGMPNKSYHHSAIQFAATLWLLISCAAFLAYALTNPKAEWDMLAYAASAETINNSSSETLHNRVYSELKERTTEDEYNAITSGNYYRLVMYEDAEAFYEQLPYYSIRVTFNTLLAKLKNIGLSVYDAGYWVSATAFVFALLVLWGALNDRIHPALQVLFPLMFYKFTLDLDVVRQILADSLSSVWVVFMCVAYLRKSRLLLPLIALSVLVRVDLIIFSGLLLLLLLVTSERKKVYSLILCGGVLLGLFLTVQQWAGSYGWKTLYYFAIITDMIATHPSEYGGVGFTSSEYLKSLFDSSRYVSRVYWVTAAFSLMTLIVWRVGNLGAYSKRVCRISCVCVLYIAIHYLIFPQMYMRFFVGQNLVIFACFAIMCTHYWHVFADDRRRAVRLPGSELFGTAQRNQNPDNY